MANFSKSLTFDIFGRDKSASKTLHNLGKNAHGLGAQFRKLGSIIGVAFGVGAIVNFGKESVAAFLDAQTSQLKLEDAFKRFPGLADTNIASLRKLNKAIEAKTGFDDDAVAASEAVLAGFKLTGKQLKELTPLVVDYARKTGTDLPTSAQLLGKAMLGNTRALKTIGIKFHDTGTAAGNYKELLKEVAGKVGGYANQFGTTDAGKIEIMKAKFNDLQEQIGSGLTPILSDLVDKLNKDVFPAIEHMSPVTKSVNGAIFDFVGTWLSGFATIQQASYNFGYSTSGMFHDLGNHIQNFWNGLMSMALDSLNLLIRSFDTLTGAKIPQITNHLSTKLPTNTHGRAHGAPRAKGGPTHPRVTAISLAAVGIVRGNRGGVLAHIGERSYDEAVVPLTSRVLGQMGGQTVVHLTVQGFVGGPNELVRRLRQLNIDSGRRTGVKFV